MGIGGFTAFALGVVAWVLGMNESWYIGPLSGLIGKHGGDIGNQFAFIVTLVAYVPARYFELKYFGR